MTRKKAPYNRCLNSSLSCEDTFFLGFLVMDLSLSLWFILFFVSPSILFLSFRPLFWMSPLIPLARLHSVKIMSFFGDIAPSLTLRLLTLAAPPSPLPSLSCFSAFSCLVPFSFTPFFSPVLLLKMSQALDASVLLLPLFFRSDSWSLSPLRETSLPMVAGQGRALEGEGRVGGECGPRLKNPCAPWLMPREEGVGGSAAGLGGVWIFRNPWALELIPSDSGERGKWIEARGSEFSVNWGGSPGGVCAVVGAMKSSYALQTSRTPLPIVQVVRIDVISLT